MLRQADRTLRMFSGDEAGQTTIEYALLLAAVALPSIYVFRQLLAVLAEHYSMITFLETLPYP